MFESDNFFLTNWPDSYLEERLEASRVWSTLENGFEIHELNSNRMDDVVRIIKVNNNNQISIVKFEIPISVSIRLEKRLGH